MMSLLKEFRETLNISQRDLANLTNLSRTKIYNLEKEEKFSSSDFEKISSVIAERIDLAYVAGLFDRASSITIMKLPPKKIHKSQISPSYVSRIVFGSKHRLLCEIIKNVFKTGKICESKVYSKYRKDLTRWNYYAHCESVDEVLEKLLPYVKIKRAKIQTMLEFRKFLEASKKEYYKQKYGLGLAIQDFESHPKNWNSVKETAHILNMNINSVLASLDQGRLKGVKIDGRWRIAPILNIEEVKNNSVKPVISQEILDKYEYFYNKIRQS